MKNLHFTGRALYSRTCSFLCKFFTHYRAKDCLLLHFFYRCKHQALFRTIFCLVAPFGCFILCFQTLHRILSTRILYAEIFSPTTAQNIICYSNFSVVVNIKPCSAQSHRGQNEASELPHFAKYFMYMISFIFIIIYYSTICLNNSQNHLIPMLI